MHDMIQDIVRMLKDGSIELYVSDYRDAEFVINEVHRIVENSNSSCAHVITYVTCPVQYLVEHRDQIVERSSSCVFMSAYISILSAESIMEQIRACYGDMLFYKYGKPYYGCVMLCNWKAVCDLYEQQKMVEEFNKSIDNTLDSMDKFMVDLFGDNWKSM